jgi:hypothetical protein
VLGDREVVGAAVGPHLMVQHNSQPMQSRRPGKVPVYV